MPAGGEPVKGTGVYLQTPTQDGVP
jgi:hypothetical protein